jgi:hypothetical protein
MQAITATIRFILWRYKEVPTFHSVCIIATR